VDLDQLGVRLATGLARAAVAIRAGDDGDRRAPLERTVAQQLVLLVLGRSHRGLALDQLAAQVGLTETDTLEAVGTLVREGLASLGPAPSYTPAEVRVALTELGRTESPELLNWAADLLVEIDRLDERHQRRLLGVVVRHIASMQAAGQIPITRMCATCRFFDPFAHVGSHEPHHCHLVDAPFGHRALRLRCPDQEPRARSAVP
jgi:hypothetical protein